MQKWARNHPVKVVLGKKAKETLEGSVDKQFKTFYLISCIEIIK